MNNFKVVLSILWLAIGIILANSVGGFMFQLVGGLLAIFFIVDGILGICVGVVED